MNIPYTNKHPIQPVIDVDGIHRFKANTIVRYLLDSGPFSLNSLAEENDFPQEDWEQFAQLIGYSVCGACDLSYVSDRVANTGMRRSERLHQQAPAGD